MRQAKLKDDQPTIWKQASIVGIHLSQKKEPIGKISPF